MNTAVNRPHRLAAILAAALLASGCSKVSAENYAKLKVGMSYQEISEELGIEMGTVKSRINRAVASLREAYGRSEMKGVGM